MSDSDPSGATSSTLVSWAYTAFEIASWPISATYEKFFGSESADGAAAADPPEQIALKKEALTRYLSALDVSKDCTDAQRRDFAERRTKLFKAVTAAKTLNDLAKIEGLYHKLESDIDAAKDMIAARRAALALVATGKAKIKDLGRIADRGYFAALNKQVLATEAAIAAARTKSDYENAPNGLQTILAREPDARTYGAYFDDWAAKAEAFLQVYARDPDKDNRSAPREVRNAKAKAAAAKALALDFAGARAELDSFWTDPSLTGGDSTANATDIAPCAEFMATYNAFLKTHDKKRDYIKKAGMPCSNKMDQRKTTIRQNGIKNKNWAAAKSDLDDFMNHIDALYPLAQAYTEIKQLQGAMAATDEPLASMLAAKATADTKIDANGTTGFADAKAAFDGIGAAEKAQATRLKRLSAISKEVDAVEAGGHRAAKIYLAGQFPAIRALINSGDANADTEMDAIEAELRAVNDWASLVAEARVLRSDVDNADAFRLLAPAQAKSAAHNYSGAKNDVATAIANYRLLKDLLALEEQVTLVRDAQPADTPAFKMLDDALREANDLARNQGKIQDAVTRFDAVLQDPALAQTIHEAGLWARKFDKIKARHDKIVPGMTPPNAKKTMVDLFAKVTAKGTVDKDYPEAMKFLDAYALKLGDAQRYVTARGRCMTVKKALDRAAATFAGQPNVPQVLYGAADDGPLKAAIQTEEAKAIAGKVSEAAKGFEDLLLSWKDKLKATALLHEQQDSVGSNAGHSIDRHGPEITEERLLRRLTTGIANDDKLSPTPASSMFETFEAWLEAREAGAAIVEGKTHPDGTAVRVTDTKIPADANAEHRVDEIIEHDGPIDKAFIGLKPGISVNPHSGKVEKGKTYETYEALSGITKSKTLWLFEIDTSAIVDQIEPTGTIKWTGKPATYIAAYNMKPDPKAALTDIPGKWVMMQLYPLTKNWNQEEQRYDP